MWTQICPMRSVRLVVLVFCALAQVALCLRFPSRLVLRRPMSPPPFPGLTPVPKSFFLQSQPNPAILPVNDEAFHSAVVDRENVDVYSHLRNEFAILSRGKGGLSFEEVSRWAEIEALVADGVISHDQLAVLFKQSSKDGGLESALDVEAFLRFNDAIDSVLFQQVEGDAENEDVEEALEEKYWESSGSTTKGKSKSARARAESSSPSRQNGVGGLLQAPQEGEMIGEYDNDEVEGEEESEGEEELEDEDMIAEIDVWDPACTIEDFFESDHKRYLREFFDKHSSRDALGRSVLSLHAFTTSEEIKRLNKDLSLDEALYSELWDHAVSFERAHVSRISPPLTSASEEDASNAVEIGFDTFLRLNYELEELVAHIRDAVEGLTPEEMDKYFEEEFVRLTGPKGFLSYQQLLEWEMVQELMEDDELTGEQLREIWEILPKRQVDPEAQPKGFGSRDELALDREGFLMLSHSLQELLNRQEEWDEDEDGAAGEAALHAEGQDYASLSSAPSSVPQSLLAK